MDSVTFLMILVGVIGVYYVYSRAWRHPEGFKESETNGPPQTAQKKANTIVVEEEINKPYATDSIRGVDDYEYSLIFKNEGDRGMTKAVRDTLMSKYPMDWTTQPPSSQGFQNGLAAFKEAFANPVPSNTQKGNPYSQIDGSKMTPPDTLADEQKEREILQTYTPKDPQSLTTYNAADAKELIEKIYDAKGLVAEYAETGPNQFTIIGTRKKDEKIVYEDDPQVAPTGQGPIAAAGEGTIIVPAVAAEVQGGLDPFFTPSNKTRDGKWDYTSWTPGLERMFAPTEPQTNWY